jgi:hypothetical protein
MEQLFLKRPAPPLEDDSDTGGEMFQTSFISEPKPLPLKHKAGKVMEMKSGAEFKKVPSLVSLIKNPGAYRCPSEKDRRTHGINVHGYVGMVSRAEAKPPAVQLLRNYNCGTGARLIILELRKEEDAALLGHRFTRTSTMVPVG